MQDQRLLTPSDFRALLGNICERKFQQLQADGVVPAPLELGPRVPRWTWQDYLDTVQRLPRREKAPEPAVLSQGRRSRIDAIKRKGAA